VVDPELHFNIVDLGLVYGVTLMPGKAMTVHMTLTSPGCPYGPVILHEVREVLKAGGAEVVEVELVWDPPWSQANMSDEARLQLGLM
jgi:metal-sulfur cluster biosynthetic enzyme